MEKYLYLLTVVLIILVCFFMFRFISRDYLEYKKLNPYLIEHIQQIGNADNVIPSNMIRKSIDQKNGMEFTYAFWFNIDAVKDGERMNILKKGNNDCPGIYVSTNSSNHDNTMNIEIDLTVWPNKTSCEQYNKEKECVLNNCKYENSQCQNFECSELNSSASCYNLSESSPSEQIKDHDVNPCCNEFSYCDIQGNKCVDNVKKTCIVNNIPINKWTHLIVMLVGNYLDVFVNGNLYERFEIKGVVYQNNDNLIIGDEPRAIGNIMRLQYFNYAIPVSKMNKMLSNTEITKNIKKEYEDESTTDYLDKNYWIKRNSDINNRKL